MVYTLKIYGMIMKVRIDELTDILNKAAYEYYTLDSPSITDQEYDKYLKELETLEEKYPEYKEYLPKVTEQMVKKVIAKLNMRVKLQVVIDLVISRYQAILIE